jgi:hypothetical protein
MKKNLFKQNEKVSTNDDMMRRNTACFYAVAMFMSVMSGADPEGDCSSLCSNVYAVR